MKKLIQRILGAFMAVFIFVIVCTPVSFAVAPVALVEAALVSFVASTGYKLYVQNGTGSDLLGLISDLYDTYLEAHPTEQTLLALAQGNFVYNDVSGHIIITKTAADIFQSFSDWLEEEYEVPVDSTKKTWLISPVYSNTLTDGKGRNFMLVTCSDYVSYNSSGTKKFYVDTANPIGSGYAGFGVVDDICIGSDISGRTVYLSYYNGNIYGYSNLSGQAYQAVKYPSYYGRSGFLSFSSANSWCNPISYAHDDGRVDLIPVSSVLPTTVNFNELAAESSTGLLTTLATNVLDKTAGLTQEKAIVVDVGAASGATAQEIADSVVAGYDSETGEIPVTDTIVSAGIIDTPVQEYPDFNDLGLPELGLALIERFPFCIPYDFVHLITFFDADPVPPYIVIDLFPSSFREKIGLQPDQAVFVLDMTDQNYAMMGSIMRWGSLVGFCFVLIGITKRLIWTS